MRGTIVVFILVALAIITGIIDANLRLAEKRENQVAQQDWTIEDLYNPTDEWCFLDQEHPLPVDCQFKTTFLGKEIE
jgi:hypothetical protein|tara:strand:- start:244 stop:474 length:231 start_codon:yes stop_codon:yes gene_type:complete